MLQYMLYVQQTFMLSKCCNTYLFMLSKFCNAYLFMLNCDASSISQVQNPS